MMVPTIGFARIWMDLSHIVSFSLNIHTTVILYTVRRDTSIALSSKYLVQQVFAVPGYYNPNLSFSFFFFSLNIWLYVFIFAYIIIKLSKYFIFTRWNHLCHDHFKQVYLFVFERKIVSGFERVFNERIPVIFVIGFNAGPIGGACT